MKKTLSYSIIFSLAFLLCAGMAWHKKSMNAQAGSTRQTHISISLEHPLQDLLDNPDCAANGNEVLASITRSAPVLKDHFTGITMQNVMVAAVFQDCSTVSYKEVYQKANYISRLKGSYFQEIFIPPC